MDAEQERWRAAVHKALKKLKYVKEFRLGEFGEGDTGRYYCDLQVTFNRNYLGFCQSDAAFEVMSTAKVSILPEIIYRKWKPALLYRQKSIFTINFRRRRPPWSINRELSVDDDENIAELISLYLMKKNVMIQRSSGDGESA